jgi:hypothetical protein
MIEQTDNFGRSTSVVIHENKELEQLRDEIGFANEGSYHTQDLVDKNKHHVVIEKEDYQTSLLKIALQLFNQEKSLLVPQEDLAATTELLQEGDVKGFLAVIDGKQHVIITGSYNDESGKSAELFNSLSTTFQNEIRRGAYLAESQQSQAPTYVTELAQQLISTFETVEEPRKAEVKNLLRKATLSHEFAHLEQKLTYFKAQGMDEDPGEIFEELEASYESRRDEAGRFYLKRLLQVYWKIKVFEEAQAIVAENLISTKNGEHFNTPHILWRVASFINTDRIWVTSLLSRSLGWLVKNGHGFYLHNDKAKYQQAMMMLVLGDVTILDNLTEDQIPELLRRTDEAMAVSVRDIGAFMKPMITPEMTSALDEKNRQLAKEFIELVNNQPAPAESMSGDILRVH